MPGVGERVLAIAVGVVSLFVLGMLAPFAHEHLPPMPSFLPAYQSALVACDLATAMLIFREFALAGARPLLRVGAAYVFSAAMAVAHALSFPGLFSPTGLFGSGPQTTAWLYFAWHVGFAAALIDYALDERVSQGRPAGKTWKPIAGAVASACGVAAVLFFISTGGHAFLPTLMQGNSDLPAKYFVALLTCAAIFASVWLLARRAKHSSLDLWLAVAGIAWLCDVALAAVFNAGRYSLGWYAGRAYGLLTAVFVLVLLASRLTGRAGVAAGSPARQPARP